MSPAIWISIIGLILSLGTTYFLAFKQGQFKRTKLIFNHVNLRGNLEPIFGIIKTFDLPERLMYDELASLVPLEIINMGRHSVEDIIFTVEYPSQYFNEERNPFKLNKPIKIGEAKGNYGGDMLFTINQQKASFTYEIKQLNANMRFFVEHPVFQRMADFNARLQLHDPHLTIVQKKDFVYYPVRCTLSCKTLTRPIIREYWVFCLRKTLPKDFLIREQLLINELARKWKSATVFFETQIKHEYEDNKTKVLVAKGDRSDPEYLSFPLKSKIQNS